MLTPETTPQKKQKSQIDLSNPVKLEFNKQPEEVNTGEDTLVPPPSPSAEKQVSLSSPASATPATITKQTRIDESSIYFQGKALFQRGSKTSGVIGRDSERQHIAARIKRNLKHRSNGALYISGLPGTGKSALVYEILSTLTPPARTKIASINCMTIDRPEQTYNLIAKEFGYIDRKSQLEKPACIDLIQGELKRKDSSHILVLDELDRIVTTDQEILFKIFEWACGASNLTVIGIANAIDLTDRFLPRLQAHKLKPEVLAFKPYNASGIAAIIDARLKELPGQLMHPGAVRICAAKTAANSGDLRKAFDICRRSIEIVEEQGEDLVTTAIVAKVCQIAYGGVDAKSRLELLNFQQKAVLCVLMKTERLASSPNITVVQAYQDYERRCVNIPCVSPLTYTEYIEVVNALESTGLVAVTGVCGKKGLGSHGSIRISKGGGGASTNKGSDGYREEFGLRKISSRAQLLDVVSNLKEDDPLRQVLLQ